MSYRPANLDRPSWQWSTRDWQIFRAACRQTDRQKVIARQLVTAHRSGTKQVDLAIKGKVSHQYVSQVLAAEKLRDEWRMKWFFERRRNLGRPIDMGGLRDTWIETDLDDEGFPCHAP